MSDELWSIELGRGVGVIELGAMREEIARRLKEHKIELDLEDEDDWLWVEEMNAELHFRTTEPKVLREIVVEDEQVRLGPMEVIGKRLHEVVGFLRVADSETAWRPWDDEEGEEKPGRTFEPQSDEELLDGGTLWIPALGLGVSMLRGDIDTVRLRKPEDAPQTGVGTLTAAQRELSARENLREILVRQRNVRPLSWLQTFLGLGLAAALGLVFWRAVDYQRRWNDAPVVEGEVIAVNPPPPEPFPREFTVAYRDQSGGEHRTVFKPADVYIVREVGEKVDLRYLPDAPDQPMGPARVRDAAFIKFVPWGIGVVGVYLVLQVVLSVIGWILRGLRVKQVPTSASVSEA